MTLGELRQKYLTYFKERGHAVIPSSSLVPENDPTTLFTGSGMQPLVPYLLGKDHPQGTRLTDSQKCFRSMDIEEVGDNRHTTFFEMLGNWSLGDYFKAEQLPWFFDFLTGEIGLKPENLYVTVFIGDEQNNIPRDTESAAIWKKLFAEKGITATDVIIGSEADGARLGMQGGRIFYYEAKKNWWSRAGTPEHMPPGEPGGPDSEMFYDFGPNPASPGGHATPHDPKFGPNCHPNCDCGRFLEIGNSVFMQYLKKPDGTFGELPKRNVDFGGGLERIAMAAQHSPDIIAACHEPILKHLERASGKTYGKDSEETRAFRIIADHMKAAVFLIAAGVYPSNTDQGYFVRRLLRRSVRYADKLGISESSLSSVVTPIADMYQDQYPDVLQKVEQIRGAVADEEEKFRRTLVRGLRVLASKLKAKLPGHEDSADQEMSLPQEINGAWVFDFYQTYGFPFELLTEELVARKHITPEDIDALKGGFNAAKEAHQVTSQQGSEQKFKGGLADHSDMSVRYHTATHLLHQALRDVLGPEVYQKGSNITPERLRFDFSFPRKMTEEEKKRVEDMVNQKIRAALPVTFEDLPIEEAQKRGAIGLFEEKYGDKVRVYTMGDYSMEFCGGPHVGNTSELEGVFTIQKEEAVSQGVRRVKAVLVRR